jgi:signal transduction histidine kinase/FixJ family two-component response regulator
MEPVSPDGEISPVDERATRLYEEHRDSVNQRTDWLFGRLMLFQWAAALAVAYFLTPLTWAGRHNAVHIHVWTAVLLGGLIAIPPFALSVFASGRKHTRHVIAIAQMLMSALLIHLTGGRVETHFHVFGSLALLAFYRDPWVFAPATIVVAVDHFVRGVYWPESVFGEFSPSSWRWTEHAGWVLFENTFLIRSCLQGRREMRDIATQRAELEATNGELHSSRTILQSLFESLPGSFLVLTPALNIVSASDAYLNATMTRREDILGRGIFEAFPDNPDDRLATGTTHLRASLNRVLQTGLADTMAIQKHDIRRPDQVFEERYWSPINSPVFGTDRRVEYVIHRVEDVTDFVRHMSQPDSDAIEVRTLMEQMQIEIFRNSQQLQSANRQLHDANAQLLQAMAGAEAANRAKSTFLSTMSHEIRTPMNAILGYTQLMLRDSSLGTGTKENLNIISRSGAHLLTLINDVLDMSKIEAGGTEIDPITFSLPRLTEDLTEMFKLRARAKTLAFDVSVDGEAAPYIVTDEGKTRQILINLLGNAVKFTQQGSIKLHITLERRKADRLWMSASVEDTGMGITEEGRAKLFQPFSQIRNGLEDLKGTGLGLVISRRYARLLGGDITVTSVPGIGSTFKFEIPIERGDSTVTVLRPVSRRVVAVQTAQEPPRILIVDDRLENRDWLMKLLKSIGFDVQTADNGEVAVKIWKAWSPQLILMDVHMPVMDGLVATRKIKSHPQGRETIVIGLSASALSEDRRAVVQCGADGFVSKPCQEDELLETIRGHLNISYEYEGLEDAQIPAVDLAGTLSVGKLTPLPLPLLEEIRDAVLTGDKQLLDKLLLRVRETGIGEPGDALQKLSDSYEYDTMTQLLEEACRR